MSIHERALKGLNQAVEFYKSDLRALTQDQLTTVPMGKARRACDFSWEVVEVNLRVAKRMAGETLPPPGDDWTVCPPEHAETEKLVAAIEDSAAKLTEAFKGVGEEGALKEIETPTGPRTPLEMLSFASMHMMYHDGQLNLLQSMHGDSEMHWPM